MPIWGRATEGFAEQLNALDEACKEAGRDRAEIEVSVYYAPEDPDTISSLVDMGVDRLIFGLQSVDEDKTLSLLDEFQKLFQ